VSNLMEISLADVPWYLQEGTYFRTLSEQDDGFFSVPANVLKSDLQVESNSELRHLLLSLQFWIVCSTDHKKIIIKYMLDTEMDADFLLLVEEFRMSFPFLQVILVTLQSNRLTQSSVVTVQPLGQYVLKRQPCSVEILMHLIEHDTILNHSPSHSKYRQMVQKFIADYTVESVAEEGHIEMLKCLFENNIAAVNLCYHAAKNGHLDCLEYLLSVNSPLHDHTSRIAALNGLRDNNKHLDTYCCHNAAMNGHLNCLKYLRSIDRFWNVSVPASAAGNSHLDCLIFAHENGCPWDKDTCRDAAKGGHLSCLQYAHTNGCPWDDSTCSSTASGGYLACLQYVHEEGCPWNTSTCANAASGGHLLCLRYARTNGCPWNANTCSSAAEGGHLQCLQFAHENGCEWGTATCRDAATGGHLDCLKYARDHGCAWNANTCSSAASGGHLSCLQYAHAYDCPWDTDTCAAAAFRWHLDCLQFAHEKGCPWDDHTTRLAIMHYPCLTYALSRGCPYDAKLAEYAFQARHDQSGFYIIQNCKALSSTIYTYAANGRLAILEACVRAKIPWHKDTRAVAAAAGHIECLVFAVANGAPSGGLPKTR